MANNQASYTPQNVPTGNPPDCKIGRRAIHITIDFSLGAIFTADLSQAQQAGGFDSLQTIYVDNRNGAGGLKIDMGVTLQDITVPAGAQGYFPVLQNNPPRLTFQALSGTPLIDVQLLNFFVPPGIWYTSGLPVNDLTLAAVISGGAVNVNSTPLTLTGAIDATGTITTGGTAQTLFAADAGRKRFIISNPSTATEILQFRYKSSGTGWIDLLAGETWDEDSTAVSGDEIDIVAATTGHVFTAWRWG